MVDPQRVKAHLRARDVARRRAHRARFRAAAADCRAIVRMIRERYAPARIVQWGSLLAPRHFDEHSDIDIAVEGIVDAEAFFALLGDAMAMTAFKVDIVQLEKIEPEFAELILMKGKIIHDGRKPDPHAPRGDRQIADGDDPD